MIGSLIGREVRGRGGIVEHIESKEFILQLKTPRRDVIIHVKELIRVASLFPTMNVMTARRIPTPKFYWPTINGMFLEWAWYFGANLLIYTSWNTRLIANASGVGTCLKGACKNIRVSSPIPFQGRVDILEQYEIGRLCHLTDYPSVRKMLPGY